MPENKINRKYKDSLFVHLFCTDRDGPKNFLDLYNALNDTNLNLETTTLQDVHIDGVLYAGQENDVSMLVNGKVVMLCEQQSSVNENMPLRCLMYISKIYERQLSEKIRFKRNMQKIPKPEFFVFYNGLENQPAEQKLSLKNAFVESDSSLSKEENTLLDLQVTVYNINKANGKQKWEKCRAMLDYSRFVTLTREEHNINPDGFMERAILTAMKSGIMTDFLNRNAKEIKNMFFGEYDYDMDIAVQREEAFEDGRIEGRTEGEQQKAIEDAVMLVKKYNAAPETAAEDMNAPLNKVLEALGR